jgi:hypothetical protein
MPISIIETTGPGQRVLTNCADGFLLWLDLVVTPAGAAGFGNPQINSGLLAFTYDGNNGPPNGPGLPRPTPNAPQAYQFGAGAPGSIDVQNAVVHECLIEGSPVRRSVIAVADLQTNAAGNLAGWLISGAWVASPPAGGWRPIFAPALPNNFVDQTAAWGGAARFASRISPGYNGNVLQSIGIIAPLVASPLAQSFYNLCNGNPPGAAVANVAVPAINISIQNAGNTALNPAGATGYAMVCHGVLAPDRDEAFRWLDWVGLTRARLMSWAVERSYAAQGAGAPPNDNPQEILYFDNLIGAAPIPTF